MNTGNLAQARKEFAGDSWPEMWGCKYGELRCIATGCHSVLVSYARESAKYAWSGEDARSWDHVTLSKWFLWFRVTACFTNGLETQVRYLFIILWVKGDWAFGKWYILSVHVS